MSEIITKAVPPRIGTAPYLAAQYILQHGPQLEYVVLEQLNGKLEQRRHRLQVSIRSGWLLVLSDGRIDCGDLAHEHLGGPSKAGYKGERAGPRVINVMHAKAWVPPKPLIRDDAQDTSQQAFPSHFGSLK